MDKLWAKFFLPTTKLSFKVESYFEAGFFFTIKRLEQCLCWTKYSQGLFCFQNVGFVEGEKENIFLSKTVNT